MKGTTKEWLWKSLTVVGIVGLFIGGIVWFFGTTKSTKDGFNEDNLRSLGFIPIDGQITRTDNMVFVDKASSFVSLAKQWNVTIVFLADGFERVWFAHEGIIYLYEW